MGRTRHNISVRRQLSGKFFNFSRFRENADTKIELIVKPIDDETAIKLGADLIADVLLMSLMFIYMFYSIYLRRKKFRDLCNVQKKHEQFILARLEFLEGELHKLQEQSTSVQ
ncbi:transmembrane protein [Babesia ovis]|uniref:Transmembrane protein n=1 Tax=Babesia ovis TaxID=5869 RepID=A0A9W5T9I1_BABOV|nr:transmembrane protein [Babesia ovis]